MDAARVYAGGGAPSGSMADHEQLVHLSLTVTSTTQAAPLPQALWVTTTLLLCTLMKVLSSARQAPPTPEHCTATKRSTPQAVRIRFKKLATAN